MRYKYPWLWLIVGLVLAILALLITASPARSQISAPLICRERAEIVETLKERFQETQQAIGLSSNGVLIEVFVSKAKTWTIIVTQTGGRSCLVAAGKDWADIPQIYMGKKT